MAGSEEQNGESSSSLSKEVLEEFLAHFDDDVLFSIARTTSGAVVVPTNRKEAVDIIMHFSSPEALLNRQKVTKKMLVVYLMSKSVKFDPSKPKGDLCRRVLQLWGQTQYANMKFRSDVKPDMKPSPQDLNEDRKEVKPAVPPEQASIGIQAGNAPKQVSSCAQTLPNNCREVAPFYSAPPDDDDAEEMEEADAELVQSPEEKEQGLKLAFEFSEWFYPRLNKLEDFKSDHFWKDCNFRLLMESAQNPREINIMKDGDSVYVVFRALVAEEGFFFNPNTMNGIGIRGCISPHGLGQIVVCGTLHKGPAAVGTFEHLIGLMKDPNFNNSFRIKFSILKLRDQGLIMHSITTTTDVTMVGRIEEID